MAALKVYLLFFLASEVVFPSLSLSLTIFTGIFGRAQLGAGSLRLPRACEARRLQGPGDCGSPLLPNTGCHGFIGVKQSSGHCVANAFFNALIGSPLAPPHFSATPKFTIVKV